MPAAEQPARSDENAEAEFEALLEFLRDSRGFDFTGYKRASLRRRIARRMQGVGIGTFGDYQDFLQVDAEEFPALFDTILINVTSFFRDPEAWTYLQNEIVPGLLQGKSSTDPIRVWSAGSASGEEAYSIAMMLAEVIGARELRERVKIYATDVDENALAKARQAVYTAREVGSVPEELLGRYFEPQDGSYAFRKDLRRGVIFGRNDLVRDAPISRVDLLTCRNTLMYFNSETQARILRRFHFALADGGVLFLGKAETLLSQSALFRPVEARRRFFRRLPGALPTGPARDRAGADPLPDDSVLAAALDAAPAATVIVGPDGGLAWSNRRARELLGLTDGDLGRPIRELDVSLRPLDLRPLLDRTAREGTPAVVSDVEWLRGDVPLYLDVTVVPVTFEGPGVGAAVFYTDVTAVHRLQVDLDYANKQLETSYEELQSTVEELETTNEELQSTVEELETTNEELETTNEELQSTVEELETTNEELETTNEELQSTNEELETTNEELQSANDELSERGTEIAAANAFQDAILRSLDAAVVVVDTQLVVTAWSARAEHLWGLRAEEAVGQHLMNLDIGLPLERLGPAVRQVIAGRSQQEQLELNAVGRRGRSIVAQVRITDLSRYDGDAAGAILLMSDLEAGVGQATGGRGVTAG